MMKASVIIAAWNAADTLARSVESALAQEGDGVAIEAIVVDDASRDDTAARAEALAAADPRVRWARLAVNGGPSAARNRAIEMAEGAWLAVLDADDVMAPGRLAAMIAAAEEVGADVLLDNFQRVDGDDRPIEPEPFLSDPAFATRQRWDLEAYVAGNAARGDGAPSLGYLKPILRARFLAERAIAYDESLRNSEDCHLVFACLAEGGAVWFEPITGYRYTVRDGSLSHRMKPEHADALIAADAAFVARRADALSPRLRAMFAERARALGDLAASERMLQALKSGRPGAAARAAMARPRALGRAARSLGEALRKRVRGGG